MIQNEKTLTHKPWANFVHFMCCVVGEQHPCKTQTYGILETTTGADGAAAVYV